MEETSQEQPDYQALWTMFIGSTPLPNIPQILQLYEMCEGMKSCIEQGMESHLDDLLRSGKNDLPKQYSINDLVEIIRTICNPRIVMSAYILMTRHSDTPTESQLVAICTDTISEEVASGVYAMLDARYQAQLGCEDILMLKYSDACGRERDVEDLQRIHAATACERLQRMSMIASWSPFESIASAAATTLFEAFVSREAIEGSSSRIPSIYVELIEIIEAGVVNVYTCSKHESLRERAGRFIDESTLRPYSQLLLACALQDEQEALGTYYELLQNGGEIEINPQSLAQTILAARTEKFAATILEDGFDSNQFTPRLLATIIQHTMYPSVFALAIECMIEHPRTTIQQLEWLQKTYGYTGIARVEEALNVRAQDPEFALRRIYETLRLNPEKESIPIDPRDRPLFVRAH